MAEQNDVQLNNDAPEAVEKKIKFVKMTRDPKHFDAPHEAQVHPDEVTNYARGGWVKA